MLSGSIYKISFLNSHETYIGSTSRTINERYSVHKSNMNKQSSPLYIHWRECGKENAKVELIEKIQYDNKQQLLELEKQYIKAQGTLNKRTPYQTHEEFLEFQRTNKRKNYHKHKDSKKAYYQANKDRILQQYKEKYHQSKTKTLSEISNGSL